jgi:hypothetical protein
MNLVEVLLAALVFAMASGSSLLVWGGSAASNQSAQLQEQGLLQIDADLQRSEGSLRHAAATRRPLESCDAAVAFMQQAVVGEARPNHDGGLPAAVVRQVLSQRLQLAGTPVAVLVLRYGLNTPGAGPRFQRERLLAPQAYGLCGASKDLAQHPVPGGMPPLLPGVTP